MIESWDCREWAAYTAHIPAVPAFWLFTVSRRGKCGGRFMPQMSGI